MPWIRRAAIRGEQVLRYSISARGSLHSCWRRCLFAVELPDGRVLIAGGIDWGETDGTAESGGYKAELASAEIYDPETEIWTEIAPMLTPRAQRQLTLLQDGRVLATGGSEYNCSASMKRAEFFEPRTGEWSMTAPMRTDRREHTATLLPIGEVLITGGYPGGVRSSEVFTPCGR